MNANSDNIVCTTGSVDVPCAARDFQSFALQLTSPVKFQYRVDDIRTHASSPLEWYFKLSTKLVSNVKLFAPLSRHMIFHQKRWRADLPFELLANVLVISDMSRDHVFYTAGTLPFAGTLIPQFTYLHFHVGLQESLMFRGTLNNHALLARIRPCGSVTSDAGYASNAILRNKLMHMNNDHVVCLGRARYRMQNGTAFYRRANVHCRHWRFEANASFTVVNLMGKAPEMSAGARGMERPHGIHAYWWVYYNSSESTSHISYQYYNSEVGSVPAKNDYHNILQNPAFYAFQDETCLPITKHTISDDLGAVLAVEQNLSWLLGFSVPLFTVAVRLNVASRPRAICV